MNPLIQPLAALLCCLIGLNLAASARTDSEPVTAYPSAPRGFGDAGVVALGTSRDEVLMRLGEPSVRAGDEFWVYWDFLVSPEDANIHGFDALVIRFERDAVVRLRVSDSTAIRRALAQHVVRRPDATAQNDRRERRNPSAMRRP